MNNTIETYMGNAIKDKNINTFLGFLEGIAIDGKINVQEVDALLDWYKKLPDLHDAHFESLFKVLSEITFVHDKKR